MAAAAAAAAMAAGVNTGGTGALLHSTSISTAERRFMEDGIRQNLRGDGRSCLDYRPMAVELDVITGASASVRVSASNVEVVAAVKCEVGTPAPETPNEGVVLVDVSVAPSSSWESQEDEEQRSAFLSQVIQSLCLGRSCVDRRALSVREGLLCWRVFVDVVVFKSGGALLDAIAMATRLALLRTRLPLVTVEDADDGKVELQLNDSEYEGTPFPAERVPVCVTVGQICGVFVWDLSSEEEAAADMRVTTAINPKGECVGIQKGGTAPLPLNAISIILRNSQLAGKQLVHAGDSAIRGGGSAAAR
eukprot:GHVU01031964.1.p1 GENE.GHVU01031964.1~~GHVU01031964.1.p1  ORF type:complete len:305 (+),score=72.08 GHVU01031964.1:407-1321(+)